MTKCCYKCKCCHCQLTNDERIAKYVACHSFEYRNNDGTGNNPLHPEWGSAGAQLMRIAPAEYDDGISSPQVNNKPNAREVSNVIFAQDLPQKNPAGASAYFWLWGQFLDHDLDLTGEAEPKEPFNIPVPTCDKYFDPNCTGTAIIPLNRSIYDSNTGTDPANPRQQITQVTSYIDGSNIYGSSNDRMDYLRTFKDGKLMLSAGGLPPVNNGYQPNAGTGNPISGMFVCGDVRANEHLGLTAMHNLFIREHNYWADLLKKANRTLNDEELYQRARVIVEAELQSISFNDFLPLLLGKDAIPKYPGYNATVNPDIGNEFSTATYRLGHTLVTHEILRLKENGDPIDWGNLPLKDAFFVPYKLCNEDGIEPLLRGYGVMFSDVLDAKIVNDLRNFLFGEPGQGGLDLASLNISRSREHGLASFNVIRQAFNLAPKTFSQITSNTELSSKLQALYVSEQYLDLWVAGLAEDHYKDAMVGETFYYALRDQFTRLRDGDRFWYENRFPEKMIKRINRTKLSDIILRNTDIKSIQKNVFLQQDR